MIIEETLYEGGGYGQGYVLHAQYFQKIIKSSKFETFNTKYGLIFQLIVYGNKGSLIDIR